MHTLLWIAVAYLAIGVLMTIVLSQTPYRDNGWVWTTLLWPLFAVALFTN